MSNDCAQRFTRTYVLALGVVAVLAAGAHGLTERMLASQSDLAGAINVSGRQRMLSQRIAAYTRAYVAAPDLGTAMRHRAELKRALLLFRESHAQLTGEAPGVLEHALPPSVRAVYFEPPHELDRHARGFVEAALDAAHGPRALEAPAVAHVLAAAEDDLLRRLDAAVGAFEDHARSETATLRALQWWLLSALLLTLLGEALLLFRPLVRSVAAQRRQLEANRGALDAIIDHLSEALLLVDEALLVERANPVAGRLWPRPGGLLGRDLGELLDLTNLDGRVLQDLLEDDRASLSQLVEAEGADGRRFPFELRVSYLRIDGASHYLVSGHDVTERCDNEERLRLYEAAFAYATEPMAICRRKAPGGRIDRIEHVNAAFIQATDTTWGEALDRRLTDMLSDQTPAEARAEAEEAFRDGGSALVEVSLATRVGAELWTELSVMPLPDDAGDVDRMICLFRDVTERRALAAVTHARAYVDPVTSLANRWSFEEQLERTVADAERDEHTIGLMFIDLDGFKQVNDRYGHDAGDLLLQEVGRRTQATLRDTDVVARLGGDEFAVIVRRLPSEAEIEALADRVIAAIEQPVPLEDAIARVGASVGLAVRPRHGEDAAALLRAADQAMYAAKQAGKGRWVMASSARQGARAAS